LAHIVNGQGDETITFGGQEVKDQGHTTLKLDLEPWRRHHFRSSRFSSFVSRFRVFFTIHVKSFYRIVSYVSCEKVYSL